MRLYSALISSVLLASKVLAHHKAGVVLRSPANNTFSQINAFFKVPDLKGPPHSSIAPYIAFDEAESTCPTSLKVGVTLSKRMDGNSSYVAWYQRGTFRPVEFDLAIFKGDVIRLMCNATGVAVENQTRNRSLSVDISDGACGYSITWGVTATPTGKGPNSYNRVVEFDTITLLFAIAFSKFERGRYYGPQERGGTRFNMTNTDGETLVATKVSTGTVAFVYNPV